VTATTIKVPSDLRDRLNREARADGVTVASVIERLLDERERAELYRRMREERAALTADERAELEAEYRVWDDAARVDAGRYDRDA
jgi:macrodomain Ter protein organizer (MatP/YcbG family)